MGCRAVSAESCTQATAGRVFCGGSGDARRSGVGSGRSRCLDHSTPSDGPFGGTMGIASCASTCCSRWGRCPFAHINTGTRAHAFLLFLCALLFLLCCPSEPPIPYSIDLIFLYMSSTFLLFFFLFFFLQCRCAFDAHAVTAWQSCFPRPWPTLLTVDVDAVDSSGSGGWSALRQSHGSLVHLFSHLRHTLHVC